MDQRHQDYIDYYRARVKKYENNPMYKNSYLSEKAIFEAISSCKELSEFKAKLDQGNLTLKNAVALIRDQETARLKFYEEIKETIKARGCAAILAALDSFTNIQDLITETNNIRQKSSLEESVDGFVSNFYGDFIALENIQVDEQADVPSRWRAERKQSKEKTIADGRELYRETTLPRAREWDPSWNMNHNLVWEERHRRLIPVPDETIKHRITEHKNYLGL